MHDATRSSRWPRWVLALAIVPTCWLVMMAVHELGHVVAALMVGVKVERVVLHPLSFSRTDVAANDSPRFIIWMGPMVGCLVPLLLWLAAAMLRCSFAFLLRFFAGFCLLANGAYIGLGWIESIGDAGDLVRSGESKILMTVGGIAALVAGLVMWNGLLGEFGFGKKSKAVSQHLPIGVLVLLIIFVLVGIALPH